MLSPTRERLSTEVVSTVVPSIRTSFVIDADPPEEIVNSYEFTTAPLSKNILNVAAVATRTNDAIDDPTIVTFEPASVVPLRDMLVPVVVPASATEQFVQEAHPTFISPVGEVRDEHIGACAEADTNRHRRRPASCQLNREAVHRRR